MCKYSTIKSADCNFISLKVSFTEEAAAHLVETPLSKDQRMIDQGDGWILIEATVQDTAELRWWLLGFGNQLEVKLPIRLRKEMQEIAHKMFNLYK